MSGLDNTEKMAQYVVRSNVHMTNLDSALSRLLGREQFIDVTLACDGHKFQCHRLILAASSPLFEELLMDNPTTHPIVILPLGIKSYTLKSLIDFMYKGQTYVNQTGLKDLVESAELLQVTGLYDSHTQIREYYEEDQNDTSIAEQDEHQQKEEINNEKYQGTIADEDNAVELGMQNQQEPLSELGEVKNESDPTNNANSASSENIVDLIEIEDSTDGPHVPEDSEVDNKDFTIEPNARFSSIINNDTNSISIGGANDSQSQQFPQSITANVPAIRVKPTIKLINLFQLTAKPTLNGQRQSSTNGNIQAASIPWTYIHIPTTNGRIVNNPPISNKIEMPQMSTHIPSTNTTSQNTFLGAATVNNSSLPFLKFNSSSMAISVKSLDSTKTQEKVKVVNMAMQPESEAETQAEPEPEAERQVEMECNHSEVQLKQEFGTENDTNEIELGDTLLSEADFPKFYAMIKKEREEKAAKLAKEKDDLTGTEAENIICQPSVSYIYGNAYDESRDIECDENESGVCIDYDRLVAETYGNEECEEKQKAKSKKQQKKKQSKLKKSEDVESTYLTPNLLPVPKNCKLKRPPTLVPLSVMPSVIGPKHYLYKQNLVIDEDEKMFFDKHRPNMHIGDCTPNGLEHQSPQTVILRNPRCNQPRHYSTESLYSALMAVKNGESIYRASRLYQVPRKTLRNWMKRWDIKSQFPMPKQLKDAAKKKKESQNA